MHIWLIALHALAASVALVSGLVAWRRPGALPVHQVTVTVGIVALIAVVAVDWIQLDLITRVVYTALCGLGVAMVLVARRAGQVSGPDRRQLIGFTLVSLTDAFVVVAVLDAGAGTPLIIGSGIAVAVIGHVVLARVDDQDSTAGAGAARASERLVGREPRA